MEIHVWQWQHFFALLKNQSEFLSSLIKIIIQINQEIRAWYGNKLWQPEVTEFFSSIFEKNLTSISRKILVFFKQQIVSLSAMSWQHPYYEKPTWPLQNSSIATISFKFDCSMSINGAMPPIESSQVTPLCWLTLIFCCRNGCLLPFVCQQKWAVVIPHPKLPQWKHPPLLEPVSLRWIFHYCCINKCNFMLITDILFECTLEARHWTTNTTKYIISTSITHLVYF